MLARMPESQRFFTLQLRDYMWLYNEALYDFKHRRLIKLAEGKTQHGLRHLAKRYAFLCFNFSHGDVDLWMMNLVCEAYGLPYRYRLNASGNVVYNALYCPLDTDDGILWSSGD